MFKSALTFWLVAATFLFSVWLNVVHGYEHDEHEQHSGECAICIHLSGLSDHLVNVSNTNVSWFQAEEHYSFTVKSYLPTAVRLANLRAPPLPLTHTSNLI